jgi:hypothetical protein
MKQENLDKLTEKALQYLNSVEAFTSKEEPEYIKELLAFKYVEHLINYSIPILTGLFIFLTLGYTAFAIYRFITKRLQTEKRTYWEDSESVTLALFCFFTFVSFLFFTCQLADFNHLVSAYKARNAPRVYLIDYFLNNGAK